MQNLQTDFQKFGKLKKRSSKIWKLENWRFSNKWSNIPYKVAKTVFQFAKKAGTYKELMTTKLLKHLVNSRVRY